MWNMVLYYKREIMHCNVMPGNAMECKIICLLVVQHPIKDFKEWCSDCRRMLLSCYGRKIVTEKKKKKRNLKLKRNQKLVKRNKTKSKAYLN